MAVDVMMMRLDKCLAEMGCGTRSEIKKKINKGLVTVDGIVAKKPEIKVDPEVNSITFEGHDICFTAYEYYMLYKPDGVISATEDSNDTTVIDLIVDKKRKDLFPVGRLDKDTVGLLLITNDGALSHRLLSPAKHVDKVYEARIAGIVDDTDINAFEAGIDIGDDKICLPAKLRVLEVDAKLEQSYIELTIQEGRFHQVKRMFHALGKEVIFLKRTQMGTLHLDENLQPGEYRHLTNEELNNLC